MNKHSENLMVTTIKDRANIAEDRQIREFSFDKCLPLQPKTDNRYGDYMV